MAIVLVLIWNFIEWVWLRIIWKLHENLIFPANFWSSFWFTHLMTKVKTVLVARNLLLRRHFKLRKQSSRKKSLKWVFMVNLLFSLIKSTLFVRTPNYVFWASHLLFVTLFIDSEQSILVCWSNEVTLLVNGQYKCIVVLRRFALRWKWA